MYGYKAFDKDLKCRDFQFEVGKTYRIKGQLEICKNGFHFCKIIDNVFNYYDKGSSRVCLVRGIGKMVEEGDKVAFESIEIVRELTKEEVQATLIRNNSGDYNIGHYNSGDYNSGDYNTGHYNSGHRNSGNYNSGDFNSRHRNSGNYNSGHYNRGHHNSGDFNTGHYNSGHYNSGKYNNGNYNIGNYNSGHYNSGHYNSGHFNTNVPKVRLFNKSSNLCFNSDEISKLNTIIYKVKPLLTWVPNSEMTEEEKKNNPSHTTTGGFLRNEGKMSWANVSKEDFEFIKSLPNFDAQIFKELTGVDLFTPKTVKITCNGQDFELDLDKARELGLIKE